MIRRLPVIIVATLLLCELPARADFIVSVSDVTLSPGTTGFVDVTISSDQPAGDLLSTFGFEFRITTTGATRLEFFSPQPDPQLSDPGYVFFGNSFAATNALPIGNVLTTLVPNDTFSGGDSESNFADVNITSSKLLARLLITTMTTLPPAVSDTFQVSLEPTNTFFFDSNFNAISFSTIPGTVAIQQPATIVPEPTSGNAWLVMLSLLTAVYFRSMRRAGARRQPCSAPSR